MKIFSPQITGSLEVDGNSTMTGSLIVTGGITGSLLGTASFATSASFAPASNPFPFTGSAVITGSLVVTGSVSATSALIMGLNSTNTNGINIANKGYTNTIGEFYDGIAIGRGNVLNFQGNGYGSYVIGRDNTIGSGNFTSFNTIIGYANTISGNGSSRIIAGGESNIQTGSPTSTTSSFSAILGGSFNRIGDAISAGIIVGTSNTASHNNSVVIGGSNISTAAANTVYVPNLDVSGSSIFRQSTVLSGSIRGEVNALSISSNTASLNCALDNFFTLQLVSGSNTFINPSNILPGQTINLRINTTGSATVSFPSSVKQVSGSAYVPTTTTGVDVVTFISFDATSLLLSNVKNLV
jgi:hypothetical protein